MDITEIVDGLLEEDNFGLATLAGQSKDPKEIDRLSKHEDDHVANLAAMNDLAHHSTLDRLSRHGNTSVVSSVAKNPSTHDNTLKSMIVNPVSRNIIYDIAGNLGASHSTLDSIYKHVAKRIDDDPSLVTVTTGRLAGNPSVHPDTLAKIAKFDSSAAERVAKNPSTHNNTLKDLLSHSQDFVAAAARKSLVSRNYLKSKSSSSK